MREKNGAKRSRKTRKRRRRKANALIQTVLRRKKILSELNTSMVILLKL